MANTKKKILSLAMVLMLVFTLMPASAFAEDSVITEDTVWDNAVTLSGNLTVAEGVTLTVNGRITVSGNITISGGGTILRGEGCTGYLITVPSRSSLTLSNITIDGNGENVTAEEALLLVDSDATLSMNEGTMLQNNNNIPSERKNAYGGGVHNKGTFIMNGGAISGNSAALGSDWIFLEGDGGGVYNEGMFTLSGGFITGNSATGYSKENTDIAYGGGVYNKGTFIMNGGTISDNTANASFWGCGGGVYNKGDFTMNTGSTISGNSVSGNTSSFGGGVYNKETFTMSGGTISGNSAGKDEYDGSGGGVYNLKTFSVANGIITANIAGFLGGGVYNSGTSDSSIAFTVRNSTISNNTVYHGAGGGLYNKYCDFTMVGSNVLGNTGTSEGLGIYVDYGDSCVIENSTVQDNETGFSCISISGIPSVSITGCTVKDNKSMYAGGIRIKSANTTTISNCTIEENAGGGIEYEGYSTAPDTLTITDCKILGNVPGQQYGSSGGGLRCSGVYSFTMRNCDIQKNTARDQSGGGIYLSALGNDNIIENCKITGNRAVGPSGSGAGIYWYNNRTTLSIKDCTISDNESGFRGGGMEAGGPVNFVNSQITGNKAEWDGGGMGVWDKITIDKTTVFSENTAGRSGDDLSFPGGYNNFNSLPSTSSDWMLGEDKVEGWFYDGLGDPAYKDAPESNPSYYKAPRWGDILEDGMVYTKKFDSTTYETPAPSMVGLKAAYFLGRYTVEYYFDGQKDDSKTAARYAKRDTVVGSIAPDSFDGYVYVKQEGTPFTVSEQNPDQVVKLFYETDKWNDHEQNPDLPDGPGSDGISDKYQAVVNFEAGSNGQLTGDVSKTQVITLEENGSYLVKQTVEVVGPTASPDSNYKFTGWSGDASCTAADFRSNMELEGGHTYTVTANFQYNESGFTPNPGDPGNGGGSGDEIGDPENPEVPPTDMPVEEPEVPTTSLPESPEVPSAPAKEPEVGITEDKTPLTNVPKTGDMVSLWLAMAALSGTGAAGVSLLGWKRRKDKE